MTGEDMPMALSKVCLAKAQFSCWKDGKFLQEEPTDCPEWEECDSLARRLIEGSFKPVFLATNYHADYMDPFPSWASKMRPVGKIGRHLFYREW
jgi:spore germination cell wall hydrolase CwlJ-like protein